MTTKKRHTPKGPPKPPRAPAPRPRTPPAAQQEEPAPDDEADEATEEAELQALALDRLAKAVHPELFMALQDNLPAGDPRWVLLFAHAFSEDGTLSPLLLHKPISLNPVRFRVENQEGDTTWLVKQLVNAFFLFPVRLDAWRARLSHAVVVELGADRCALLGRGGMSDVVAAVDAALEGALPQVASVLNPPEVPLDLSGVKRRVETAFPAALGRVRIGLQLQQAFPKEDDEELDHLITQATQGLEFQAGPAPDYAVEVRAPDRPWLPVQNVVDALSRKLAGGFRVLRTAQA
jgi:hypothetical protein